MRILLVSGSLPPLKCGVGDYCMQLATALSQQEETDVVVLTSTAVGPVPSARGPRVLAVMRSWRLGEAGLLLRVLRAEKPDVVHVQYPTQGYGRGRLPNFIPLLARLTGTSVFQTWHEPMAMYELRLRLLARSHVFTVRANLTSMLSRSARRLLGGKTLQYVPGASSLPIASLEPSERTELRRRYLGGQRRLIVFFGFIYPHKGVEHVFDVADPSTDHIVIAGEWGVDLVYKNRLMELAQGEWMGKVTFTGFLTPEQAAQLLAIADAVLLPFRHGGGDWNSSILGAVANGAPVVTTSKDRRGYDETRNITFTPVDDVAAMRDALNSSASRAVPADTPRTTGWREVAECHLAAYALRVKTASHSRDRS